MQRQQVLIGIGAVVGILLVAILTWAITRGSAQPQVQPTPTPVADATSPEQSTGENNTTPSTTDPSTNTAQPTVGEGGITSGNISSPNTSSTSSSGPVIAGMPAQISADVYLDDRSGPTQLVASFTNALNRKEYLRAYSYFDDPTRLGSFDTFANGYKDTQRVEVTTGTITDDASAGQLRFNVPVLFRVEHNNGNQIFVGCYRLGMSQPSVQTTPPFRPLAIQGITIEQINDGADTTALLGRACT
jgi:cytoskeletal protein RodZ